MKKITVFLLTLIILASFAVPAFADFTEMIDDDKSIKIHSENVYMLNLDNGISVMYSRNENERKDPASMAKLLVGILTLNQCSNLDQKVTVGQNAIDSVYGTGWGIMNLYTGETVSVRDLLYCTLIANANDTCFVLADEILGGTESCVQKMNEYVKELGCTNTHFTNVNGIADSEQYTTAKDMALIYSECIKNTTFVEIMGTTAYEMAETNKCNYTRDAYTTYLPLLSNGYSNEYTNGGKYAGTEKGTCNVVCTSSYGGYNYLLCILDAPIDNADDTTYKRCLTDANDLFTWVHTKIKLRTLVSTDTYCGEAKVKYSSKCDYVALYPEKSITALVPETIDSSALLIEIDESSFNSKVCNKHNEIKSSVKKGDFICKGKIMYADSALAEVNLIAGSDCSINLIKTVTVGVSDIARSTAFKVIIIILIILTPIAIALGKMYSNYQRKNNVINNRSARKSEQERN